MKDKISHYSKYIDARGIKSVSMGMYSGKPSVRVTIMHEYEYLFN